jgi:quercetin dioxygenase-like cupin family protein
MNRREFSLSLPAAALLASEASGQTSSAPQLVSGVYPPGKEHKAGEGQGSQAFLTGMLQPALRLEAHETAIEPGAPPEATRNHVHNEIWLMKTGTVELMADGVKHVMRAGDLGLVVAGGMHYVKNIGTDRASYFVLAVGPPE